MADTSLESILLWCYIPFFIIGFVGNVLVIRIVHKTRAMHTTTNFLLANLAVSDIITVLVGPLCFASVLVGYLSDGFGRFACKFTVLNIIAIAVSSITLTVLAVERYHALLKPFNTGLRLKEDNIKQAVALIWTLSLLFCLPFFFLKEWSEIYSTCVGPVSLHMNQATKIYVIICFILSTYIPIAVLFYCYGSLIKGLCFTNTVCSEPNGERSSEKKKLVFTFILATVVFLFGYAPSVLFYTVIASKGDEHITFNFYVVFPFLYYCSLCFNPIIYAFRSRNFQEGFKRIIFCRGPPTQNEI